MYQIYSNNIDWLIIPVPPAIGYWIEDSKLKWEIAHLVWSGNPPEPDHDEYEYGDVNLPDGEWQIFSNTIDITEKQAADIVTYNEISNGYSYGNDDTGSDSNAVDCIQSLLTALEITTGAIILKKI